MELQKEQTRMEKGFETIDSSIEFIKKREELKKLEEEAAQSRWDSTPWLVSNPWLNILSEDVWIVIQSERINPCPGFSNLRGNPCGRMHWHRRGRISVPGCSI